MKLEIGIDWYPEGSDQTVCGLVDPLAFVKLHCTQIGLTPEQIEMSSRMIDGKPFTVVQKPRHLGKSLTRMNKCGYEEVVKP